MTEDTKPPEAEAPAPEPVSNVITHNRFTGRPADAPIPQPMQLEELRKVGLAGEDLPDLDDLDLREPQYGEEIVGRLEADEAAMYVAYHHAHAEFKQVEREVGGDFLMRAGERIKNANEDISVTPGDVVSEEQAVRLFRAQRKAESLKAILFWHVCERIGHHDWFLVVRTKGRICRLQRKW